MRPVAGSLPGMSQNQSMIRIDSIWLALGASDLRKGMDSLLGHVVQHCAGGAAKHSAYVFANRGATRLKVLIYDGAGLWLCTRRLQSGRFVWPHEDSGVMHLSSEQIAWLVAGAPWQHIAAPTAITQV
jgi:transposase